MTNQPFLKKRLPKDPEKLHAFKEYFEFEEDEKISLEKVAIKRKWILKGEKPDTIRTANIILSCFREGKIGKFTLDRPEEYGLI